MGHKKFNYYKKKVEKYLQSINNIEKKQKKNKNELLKCSKKNEYLFRQK